MFADFRSVVHQQALDGGDEEDHQTQLVDVPVLGYVSAHAPKCAPILDGVMETRPWEISALSSARRHKGGLCRHRVAMRASAVQA
jgi:hypothetical protein